RMPIYNIGVAGKKTNPLPITRVKMGHDSLAQIHDSLSELFIHELSKKRWRRTVIVVHTARAYSAVRGEMRSCASGSTSGTLARTRSNFSRLPRAARSRM